MGIERKTKKMTSSAHTVTGRSSGSGVGRTGPCRGFCRQQPLQREVNKGLIHTGCIGERAQAVAARSCSSLPLSMIASTPQSLRPWPISYRLAPGRKSMPCHLHVLKRIDDGFTRGGSRWAAQQRPTIDCSKKKSFQSYIGLTLRRFANGFENCECSACFQTLLYTNNKLHIC
jgi:hypothetical protein